MDQVEWFCYFEYLNYNKTLLEALQSEVFFWGGFLDTFLQFSFAPLGCFVDLSYDS